MNAKGTLTATGETTSNKAKSKMRVMMELQSLEETAIELSAHHRTGQIATIRELGQAGRLTWFTTQDAKTYTLDDNVLIRFSNMIFQQDNKKTTCSIQWELCE